MEKWPLDSIEEEWTAEIGPYFQILKWEVG